MQIHDELMNRLQQLSPEHVELLNESMNHAGYFEGKESHFKLTIVSSAFEGKRLVARHQLIYNLAHDLMTRQDGTIHALAIHAYTPEEWQQLEESSTTVPSSPNCAGANK